MDSTFVNLARDLAMFAQDTFSNIAPEVWEMTMRKVLIVAYSQLVSGIILGTLCVIAISKGIKDECEPLCVIGGIVLVIAIPLIICGAIEWYAVDYYTLKAIMKLVH